MLQLVRFLILYCAHLSGFKCIGLATDFTFKCFITNEMIDVIVSCTNEEGSRVIGDDWIMTTSADTYRLAIVGRRVP